MFQPEQQFLNLLVPLDGSRLAEAVLPLAQLLAGRLHADVTLLHVLEQHPPATIHGEHHLADQAEAEGYLEQVAARMRGAGIAVETHVHGAREGDVARSISEHVREVAATMVVLCTHGTSGLRGLLFGSIAQQVLRRGVCPILLVPAAAGGRAPLDLARVLAPLDGTAAHEPALRAAIALTRAFDAELRLVLVIPTLATLAGDRGVPGILLPATTAAILDLAQQGAVEYLDRIVERCRADGLTASAEILRGDAVAQVLDRAEQFDADLIVMASHGRAGLDAILAGSVAPRVAGRVARPLLLVHADEAAEEDRRPAAQTEDTQG